ncbi:MAG: molybdenum cofactor guanylyltransferase [Planctomycetes bacterium]|nr:molybdenum cofactor guanylyltransferase [Planctomycetota bacterium]
MPESHARRNDASLAIAILVGGRSTRMGEDKATLMLAGEALVARMLRRLAIPGATRFVCGHIHSAQLDTQAEVTIVHDTNPGAGPLAAMADLSEALPKQVRRVFACAVDMPFIGADIVQWMNDVADACDGFDRAPHAVIAHVDGHEQVLAALWSRAALLRANQLVSEGQRSVRALLETTRTLVFDAVQLDAVDIDVERFKSFDYPEEFAAIRDREEP